MMCDVTMLHNPIEDLPVCETEDDHEYEFKADWDGDPGVINGTCDYYWYECSICGATKPATSADIPRFDDDVI